MYTSSGIPAFYVIVHFIPVPSTHVFVGGRNGNSDQGNADPSQPPMIRVNVDHIARAMATVESQKYFFTRVRLAFTPPLPLPLTTLLTTPRSSTRRSSRTSRTRGTTGSTTWSSRPRSTAR